MPNESARVIAPQQYHLLAERREASHERARTARAPSRACCWSSCRTTSCTRPTSARTGSAACSRRRCRSAACCAKVQALIAAAHAAAVCRWATSTTPASPTSRARSTLLHRRTAARADADRGHLGRRDPRRGGADRAQDFVFTRCVGVDGSYGTQLYPVMRMLGARRAADLRRVDQPGGRGDRARLGEPRLRDVRRRGLLRQLPRRVARLLDHATSCPCCPPSPRRPRCGPPWRQRAGMSDRARRRYGAGDRRLERHRPRAGHGAGRARRAGGRGGALRRRAARAGGRARRRRWSRSSADVAEPGDVRAPGRRGRRASTRWSTTPASVTSSRFSSPIPPAGARRSTPT